MSIILIHTFTFMLEYTYQQYCYPITTIGYITSMVTMNSNSCMAIKNIIQNLNGFVSNHILNMSGLVIIIFKKLIEI